jgi:23S rRNA (adenine2503-C2)-methyltransferase
MTLSAPITQDVHTIPRKLPEGPANLVGLTRDQMREAFVARARREAGQDAREPGLAVGSTTGACATSPMTNLAKDYRALLARTSSIALPEVVSKQVSRTGTRKYLVRIAGGHEVETVYIPEEDRGHALRVLPGGLHADLLLLPHGTQKLVRNLTGGGDRGPGAPRPRRPGRMARAGAPKDETRLLSNLVLMGMGEPLYNFEAVRDAMRIVMDPEGLTLSRRRITLSTSGVGARDRPHRDRDRLQPRRLLPRHHRRGARRPRADQQEVEHRHPARRPARLPNLSNSERITFEYVMLDGVNDSDEDARRLVKLIQGIPAKINLIPFNEWPGAPYRRSSNNRIRAFADIVYKAGYASPSARPGARTSWPPAASSSPRPSGRASRAPRSPPRRGSRPRRGWHGTAGTWSPPSGRHGPIRKGTHADHATRFRST